MGGATAAVGETLAPTPPSGQIAAAQSLIARVAGEARAQGFDLELLDGSDNQTTTPAFEISAPSEGRIRLAGTSGIALASAFHWYLK